MRSSGQAKKKPQRIILDLLCYRILKSIKNLGTELRKVDLPTDLADSQSSRAPEEPQALGLVFSIPKGASSAADTNSDVTSIITLPYSLCSAVYNPCEL